MAELKSLFIWWKRYACAVDEKDIHLQIQDFVKMDVSCPRVLGILIMYVYDINFQIPYGRHALFVFQILVLSKRANKVAQGR